MIPSRSAAQQLPYDWLNSRIRLRLVAVLLLAATLVTAFDAAAQGLDLARYHGKIVLVDFWASWCTPCRQSFPWLNSLQQRYADQGLVVLGVNVDRDRIEADRFLRNTPAQFPIVYDPQGTFAATYELKGMPSSFVFGPDGTLLSTHVGFKNGEREEREIEIVRLLREHVRTVPSY